MRNVRRILAFISLSFWGYVACFSEDDLSSIFRGKSCVQGSLLMLEGGPTLSTTTVQYKEGERSVLEQLTRLNTTLTSAQSKNVEKGVLTLLHELAEFNKLQYYYEVTAELGPPHARTFVIKLHLGEEAYEAEGNSIKSARQVAAKLALDNTKYEQPPVKVKEEGEFGKDTPTVQLNNLAMQQGLKVTYEIVDKSFFDKDTKHTHADNYNRQQKSYMARLNHSIYHPGNTFKVKSPDPDLKTPPFVVRVTVDDQEFYGTGLTIQSAKHNAALNVLRELKQQLLDGDCSKEGYEKSCKLKKDSIKSAVSQVYEDGQKRKMAVDFEIVKEGGPDHKKVFTTRCKFGDLFVVEAEGKSKKESKRLAAEKMLEKISVLPKEDKGEDFSILFRKNKKKKKKNSKVVKTEFDKAKMVAGNTLSSALDYVTDWVAGDSDDTASQEPSKPKTHHQKGPTTSMKEELLHITQSLGINIQFHSLKDMGDKSAALLSMSTTPERICLGKGLTGDEASEDAALNGLKLLYKLNLVPEKLMGLKEAVYESNVELIEEAAEVTLTELDEESN